MRHLHGQCRYSVCFVWPRLALVSCPATYQWWHAARNELLHWWEIHHNNRTAVRVTVIVRAIHSMALGATTCMPRLPQQISQYVDADGSSYPLIIIESASSPLQRHFTELQTQLFFTELFHLFLYPVLNLCNVGLPLLGCSNVSMALVIPTHSDWYSQVIQNWADRGNIL